MDDDFRYGQMAMEARLLTAEQFDSGMTKAKSGGRPLAEVLVEEEILDKKTAARLTKALNRVLRDERAKSEGGDLAKRQIGGYKILRRIGEGGMGEVYLAEQLNMYRQVALKVLHDKWNDDEEFRKRFLLEARQAGKLSHQNLIQVFDVGKYQGTYYFSMEYVDGVNGEDLIHHEGQVALDKVIDITLQVCDALAYLAAQDLVHRDIKPANIMITKEEVVKLGDFGFIQSNFDSELLQEGTTLGTPDYISPEQARGERNIDVRSDIYSLGASIFHMLTGRSLYQGSCSQVMRDQIDAPVPDLQELREDLPADFRRILEKMLAKDPADRYQTPEELVKDLQMVKIEVAGEEGRLPTTRSQILNVISAERRRIEELERQYADFDLTRKTLIVIAAIGWALAILFLVLWLVF